MGSKRTEYELAIQLAGRVDPSLSAAAGKASSILSGGLGAAGKLAMTGIAASATAAASAIVGVGAYAAVVGADFEAGMSRVKAISGATAEEMAQLTAKAKEMGASTKFSATESAQALSYMAMAGWKTEQMTAGLPGIMNLAAASGEELASVSDIVTDALTAFGLKAEESARFADVLAAASSNSNTNVAMMGETFKYAAPVAGALGYSIEDTALAIGLMANSGIKADMAGTALRGMLTNLAKPTAEVRGYLEKLGVSLTDAGGQVRPLGALLDDLRASFDGLTDAQKTEYAAGIAGTRGMSGLLAMVNAAPEEYDKLRHAIDTSAGAAQRMADVMNDNLRGQLTLLGSAAEGVGIQIYEGIEGPLKDAVRSGKESIDVLSASLASGALHTSLKTLGEGFGSLVRAATTLVANAIPPLIDGFAFIVEHAGKIRIALQTAGAAFVAFQGVMQVQKLVRGFEQAAFAVDAYRTAQAMAAASATAFTARLTAQQTIVGVLTGQITLAAAAQKAWNALTAANPYVLAAVALGGLITAIGVYNLVCDDAAAIERARTQTAKALREEIEREAQAQQERVRAAQTAADQGISEIAVTETRIKELKSLTDENGKVSEANQSRARTLTKLINDVIPDAVAWNEKEADSTYKIIDAIDDLIDKRKAEAYLNANREVYNDAYANVYTRERTRTQVENEIQDAQSQRSAAIGAQQTALTQWNRGEISQQAYENVQAREQQTIDGLDKRLEVLTDTHQTLTTEMEQYYRTISDVESVMAAETQGSEALEAAIAKVYTGFRTASEISLSELQAQEKEIAKTMQRVGQNMENGLIPRNDTILAHWETVLEEAKQEVQKKTEETMGVWSASVAAGQPNVNAAMELVTAGVISRADMYDALKKVGLQAGEGLAAGLRRSTDSVFEAGFALAGAGERGAKKKAKIQSPSRVFREEIGRMQAAGMALGLLDGQGEVGRASQRLSLAAQKGAFLPSGTMLQSALPKGLRLEDGGNPGENDGPHFTVDLPQAASSANGFVFAPRFEIATGGDAQDIQEALVQILPQLRDFVWQTVEKRERDRQRKSFRGRAII